MAVQNRSIFGEPNPLDNGLQPASYVSGGDDSLSQRPPYTAPVTSDQSSAQTEAERGGLESAFRQARETASKFTGSGAEGVQIGRGPDTFDTYAAPRDDGGPGVAVAPEPPVVLRADGGDDPRNSATGKAVG